MAALTRLFLSKPSSQNLRRSLNPSCFSPTDSPTVSHFLRSLHSLVSPQFNVPRPTTISPPTHHSRGISSASGHVPLHFHYEDVLRQDLLLKLNYANVMEVPGLRKVRVLPKAAPSALIMKKGKLAMEISCGQKLIQTQRASTGKSFRSNPFSGGKKGYVSDLARQSTLRRHGMSHFLIQICSPKHLHIVITANSVNNREPISFILMYFLRVDMFTATLHRTTAIIDIRFNRRCQKLPQFPLPTNGVKVRYSPPNEFEQNTYGSRTGRRPIILRDTISDLPAVLLSSLLWLVCSFDASHLDTYLRSQTMKSGASDATIRAANVPEFVLTFEKGKSRRYFSFQAILHPEQVRILTIRESARLQGFPDFYRFCGTVKDRYPQNVVAVPVAQALGYALGMSIQKEGGNEPLMTLPPKFAFQLQPSDGIPGEEWCKVRQLRRRR
ncbi:hypothetical protein C3L33_08853, partial [Rhododendron williamsianum]